MNRRTLTLYARTYEHRSKVKESENIIRNAFSKISVWYVAFSGGKDATVVLDLVEKFGCGNVELHFGDDDLIFPETREYLSRISDKCGNRLHSTKIRTSHGDYFTAFENDSSASETVPNLWEGCFMGLRAQENTIRRNLLKYKGKWAYKVKSGMWHCNPIIKWTSMDVWAYIYSNNIDYNKSYDIQRNSGIKDINLQRVIPFGYRKSLDILRMAYPSLYNEWLIKHPKVGLNT